MATKTYTIRYYMPRVGADGQQGTVASILDRIAARPEKMGEVREAGTKIQQVRVDSVSDDKTEYRASFVRFRDDLPRVGNRFSALEKPPTLADDEELIEKNHFMLFVQPNGVELISYQVSMEGSDVTALSRYLTFANVGLHTVSFDEVLTADALENLNGGVMKAVEFEIAKPRRKNFAPDPNDTWTKGAMDFMGKTGGTRFKARILTTSKNKGLVAQTAADVRMLLASNITKKLKVKMSDIDHPIDLFADRIFDKVIVELIKGWPNSSQLFDEMASSKRLNMALDIYLTTSHEALE